MTPLSFRCDFSHNYEMAIDPELARIKALLADAMQKKNISAKPLAKKAKLGETAVRDFIKNENADIRIGTLNKLADALGMAIEEFFTADVSETALGPKLFVKGEVAAGQWCDAFEWAATEWQSFTGRPDVTADITYRFGLRVCGDSMDEIYPEGTIIECVSLFGRAEAVPGKNVVVVRKRDDQMIEATVKHLVEIDGSWWLRPRSTNPAHQAYRLDEAQPGIIETRIVAVVVSSVRKE